ncbi:dihydroorotate dehydrogenase electron transfer subunit [Acidipropionibacterium jensenii]|uniref:Dihydroorotate dehydrogenase B (NAD(+)), electron transfer subunit n=1 Tax=Acidipropionibacterium jensenii TaxID=1749 RepID=A0A3T0RZS3_9ACTN|nr:dihydroorotate dehydrogenase electron transfer subunit [Acidipropionibacterium jensenii]QCV89017.1 dihydroorotate dehydrogenase electron transfer subunit [Acidipropionibacterium jensenii]
MTEPTASPRPGSDCSGSDRPGTARLAGVIRRDGPQLLDLVANTRIARDVFSLVLRRPETAPAPQPGTFLDLLPVIPAQSGGAPVLRRPLSIADCSADGRDLTVILRVVGAGSAALAGQPVGSQIDVLGPLGHGFDLDAVPAGGRALLVGGGVGVPPLYLLARRLVERGVQVQMRLGFRDAGDLFLIEEFARLGEVLISTDDGSAGARGTVADLAGDPRALAFTPDGVFACGPLPMLRHVQAAFGTVVCTQLSLEERMACGVGACYACVVTDAADRDHQHRICWDGPVFRAEEVVL